MEKPCVSASARTSAACRSPVIGSERHHCDTREAWEVASDDVVMDPWTEIAVEDGAVVTESVDVGRATPPDELVTLASAQEEQRGARLELQAAQARTASLEALKAELEQEAVGTGVNACEELDAAAKAAEDEFTAAKRTYITGRVEFGGVSEHEAAAEIDDAVSGAHASTNMKAHTKLLQAHTKLLQAHAAVAAAEATTRAHNADITAKLAELTTKLGGAIVQQATCQATLDSVTNTVDAWEHANRLVHNAGGGGRVLSVPRASLPGAMELIAAVRHYASLAEAAEARCTGLEQAHAAAMALRGPPCMDETNHTEMIEAGAVAVAFAVLCRHAEMATMFTPGQRTKLENMALPMVVATVSASHSPASVVGVCSARGVQVCSAMPPSGRPRPEQISGLPVELSDATKAQVTSAALLAYTVDAFSTASQVPLATNLLTHLWFVTTPDGLFCA